MHRDWFFGGVNVFVEIYTDRLEVMSPGGLPQGLSLEDLGNRSVRQNTLVADLIHRIGFIEKAGPAFGVSVTRHGGCTAQNQNSSHWLLRSYFLA